jgi:hypothetical protein
MEIRGALINTNIVAIGFAILVICLPSNSNSQIVDVHSFAEINAPVPDGNASGFSDVRTVSSDVGELSELRVHLQIDGEFNGDLYGYLRHISSGVTNFAVLLNRPGKTGVNVVGYADSGMDVWFDATATDGDVHLYQSVTVPSLGTPLTGSWQPDGRKTDPDLVLESSARDALFNIFNGAPASGEWTLFLADMESGGTNMLAGWELEFVGRGVPEIAWDQPTSIAYGVTLSEAELNASSPVAGTFSYDPPVDTALDAGLAQPLSVTFSPLDSVTYLSVTVQVSIDVFQKALTITADNQEKIYGAPLPALTVSYSGFVEGEDESALATPVSLSTAAIQMSPAGAYSITAIGALSPNYDVSFVNGTMTINKASLTATLSSSANPSTPGAMVTFGTMLTPLAPAEGTPTGPGQYRVDGVVLGSPTTLIDGVATAGSSSLLHGIRTIEFEYAGDVNFLGITNSLSPNQLVNTAPDAGLDVIERSPTNGTKVLISELLSNDADADGDAVTLMSVGPGSVNGGTVVLNGDWVHYDPPVGNTNVDSFTYTIEDSYGASSTGTVEVQIRVDVVPSPNLAIQSLNNGALLIRFDGIPGKTYRIQYMDDISSPSWLSLGGGDADPFGIFLFTNTPPTDLLQRYYRSVYP